MDKKTLNEFFIILVEPKYGGNVGATARVIMNFGFSKLYLVNPCKLDEECYTRAMHANSILENAHIFPNFKDSIKNMDYLVATSSIEHKKDKRHLRNSISIENLAKRIFDIEGKIGLVFGREDYGLYNEEIAACDVMLKIYMYLEEGERFSRDKLDRWLRSATSSDASRRGPWWRRSTWGCYVPALHLGCQ